LGEPVTYFEDQLTDIQIVCCYANSDLYDLGGLEPSVRDDELETVRSWCDPCAALTAPANRGADVKGLAASKAGAADVCEEKLRIAFTSGRDGNTEIYVMDANGSDPRNLTDNPGDDEEPAWSSDGTKIAFTSSRDGNAEIYVMDTDGSNQKNLSDSPEGDDHPSWSPDSVTIIP
jgi:hypothetical protein